MNRQQEHPQILRFFAEREDLHDRAAKSPGEFERLVDLLSKDPVLPIQVASCHTNFFRLDRVIAGLCERIGRDIPKDLAAFSPIPLEGSVQRYGRHIESMNRAVAESGISIESMDDVFEILQILENALSEETENTLLRTLGILSETAFIGPEVLHLDFANACNLSCLYCGLHSPMFELSWKTPEWSRRKIDLDLFRQVADDLADMRAYEHIAVCGEGEPSLHPHFMEMLEYLKKKNLGVALYTNGLLLTPQWMDRIVDMGIDMIYCTISAGTRETYVDLHPAQKDGDYDELLSNLRYLMDRRKQKGCDRPVLYVKHVLTNRNYHELVDMAKLAHRLGADYLMFEIMHPTGDETKSLLMTPMQIRELRGLVRAVKILCGKYDLKMTDHIDLQLHHMKEDDNLWSNRLYDIRGCFAGWFFSRIYTDNDVSFCCQGKILGNLDEGSFKDLWFSEEYDRIRRKAKVFDPSDNHAFRKGGNLIAPGCARCGNYYTNNHYHQLIQRLGLGKYLDK